MKIKSKVNIFLLSIYYHVTCITLNSKWVKEFLDNKKSIQKYGPSLLPVLDSTMNQVERQEDGTVPLFK